MIDILTNRRLFVFVCVCMVTLQVCASTGIDPTNKHAWSENAGWINFAPVGGGVSIHFDGSIGYLDGYAWGENIGWVKMGNGNEGPYTNSDTNDWGVNFDGSGSLFGYAWGESVGWIKFDPAYGGVVIDMNSGVFDGSAWSENIGWIHFHGALPSYDVRTIAFEKQPLGTPNWWLDHFKVTEEYDEGDHVPAWQEQVMDTNPRDPSSFLSIVKEVTKPWGHLFYFPSSAQRYYTLQYISDLTNEEWTDVPGQVDISGAGGEDVLLDTNEPPRQLHRIQVKISP